MTDTKAIQGEANVAKYMALLDSESDLKNKLQQFYLKKVEDDKAKNDEIKRLQDLLVAQETRLKKFEDNDSQESVNTEVQALSERLRISSGKLNHCRKAYSDLEVQLQKSLQEIDALKSDLNESKKSHVIEKKKVVPKKTARASKKVNIKAEPDDLQRINGVGPKIHGKLIDAGISTFEQIAKWKKADIDSFEEKLNFKGRIKRDSWVKQAKALSKKV